jgi:hypothetical protein
MYSRFALIFNYIISIVVGYFIGLGLWTVTSIAFNYGMWYGIGAVVLDVITFVYGVIFLYVL